MRYFVLFVVCVVVMAGVVESHAGRQLWHDEDEGERCYRNRDCMSDCCDSHYECADDSDHHCLGDFDLVGFLVSFLVILFTFSGGLVYAFVLKKKMVILKQEYMQRINRLR